MNDNRAPFIHTESNAPWTNQHRNLALVVERLYDVWNLWDDRRPEEGYGWRPGLLGLQQIVRQAEDAGKRVRALGGAWSLSDAAVTPEFLVNTKPLNHVTIGLRRDLVDAACAELPERLVFAQCGVGVGELNDALEAAGLALPTSGASDGQTLCGAVATGTHGSAHQIGSMQDFILGMHLVSEGGKSRWIERASRPAAGRALCEILGAELLRDDRLFEAALVSFGSFGIVHALLFAAEPLYLLERHVRRYDYDDVKGALGTLDVSGLGLPHGDELPFHFEIVLNPYATSRGQRGAWVRFMYKVAPERAIAPPVKTGPGDDLLGVVGTISDAVPSAIPAVLGALLEQALAPAAGVLRTPGTTFGPTAIRGPVLSTEIGVALADVPAAVEAILDVARRMPFGGPVALRYVKDSSALLAFTRFAPITCTIELPSAGTKRTQRAFEEVWTALDDPPIPCTFHWGQRFRDDYNWDRIHAIFGSRADGWLAARRSLLSPAGRRMFSNALVERCGLAD